MLTNAGARAMAIKMLTQTQIEQLHEREEHHLGYYLTPAEIAKMTGHTVREFWGIPDDERAQEAHAERIEAELWALCKAKGVDRQFYDIDSRFNFDWHVFHSAIDFSYRKGKSVAKAVGAVENEW